MSDGAAGPSPNGTSGEPLGEGPFTEGFRQTSTRMWVSTALMAGGFALLGLAVVLLDIGVVVAVVAAVMGAAALATGLVLARRSHLMSDVT